MLGKSNGGSGGCIGGGDMAGEGRVGIDGGPVVGTLGGLGSDGEGWGCTLVLITAGVTDV